MNLKVVEIFYSLQGEGQNMGMPAVFVRLSNCNKDCWFCDTDWNQGTAMSIEQVLKQVQSFGCNNIIWTGGEPTLQLTEEVLSHFSSFYNCIETNGSNPVPKGIDYITVSPKVTPATLRRNFEHVNEFRYPISEGEFPPSISELPNADRYFVSPVFLGEKQKRFELDKKNLNAAIEFAQNNHPWRLSIQMHKMLNLR